MRMGWALMSRGSRGLRRSWAQCLSSSSILTNVTARSPMPTKQEMKKLSVPLKLMMYLDAHDLGVAKSKAASKRKRFAIERGFVAPTRNRDCRRTRRTRRNEKGSSPHASPSLPASTATAAAAASGGGVCGVQRKYIKKIGSASCTEEIMEAGGLPEVAFIGRSNVGKSTLLNVLLDLKPDVKKRAAISPRPGQTRTLDFYRVGFTGWAKLVVIDTPGYGFAFVAEEKRSVFQSALLDYVRGRGKPLKRVCMLVDARHGFKSTDVQFLRKLYDPQGPSPLGPYAPPKLQVILTKADLLSRLDLGRMVVAVRQCIDEVTPRQSKLPVLMVSSLKHGGVEALKRELDAIVVPKRKEGG
ncbi:unnamed protein product [Chrysoparadoxa australica]